MDHPVGGTTNGGHGRRCVFKGLAVEDIARSDACFQQSLQQMSYLQTLLLLGRIDCRDGGTERRHQTDGFHGDPPGVEGSCDATTTRAWARRSNDGIGFGMRYLTDIGCGLGIIGIQDGHIPTLVAAWHDAPPTEEQTWDIHPSQCHCKSRPILVAMVGADHGIVTMSADHAFRGIGD